jgi:hypothetical protein
MKGADLDAIAEMLATQSLKISRQIGFEGDYPKVRPPSEVLSLED